MGRRAQFYTIDHQEHRGHREGVAKHRVNGMESPWESDGLASHPYPGGKGVRHKLLMCFPD
jgi:hypothetical protein